MFDFAAAMALAEKDAASTAIEAIVLAPSGGGKSTLLGTFGVKTLYLYSRGENHGVKAARTAEGSNVVPVCFDNGATPDEALGNLLGILQNVEQIRSMGFGAVVVDGASELETLIRQCGAWKKACQTAKGGHNTFAEPTATIDIFRPIITALKDLQRALGIHFAITCILDVKDLGPFGEIVDASPRLKGFSVAEALVQQFGDVLVVGKMSKGGQVKYKLQFLTELTKTSKEESGIIKRTLNFAPRISGFRADQLPPVMEASMKAVLELKQKKG